MNLRFLKLGPRMIKAIYDMDQITIAAVNGAATGGGACIAAACDFRVGADDCRVGYPEVGLGMNLSWVALPMCVQSDRSFESQANGHSIQKRECCHTLEMGLSG